MPDLRLPRLLLCSTSPRRRELLSQLGVSFLIAAPDLDESQRPGERPVELCERLAREKALEGLAAHRRAPDAAAGLLLALGADTIVVSGDRVLGKPRDRDEALQTLTRLAGAEHRVMTGVCVARERSDGPPEVHTRTVVTVVRFRALTEAAIRWLVATGDGDDKAGAYALQGMAGAFVEHIEGSVSGVVGLPLCETFEMLAQAGLPLPWSAP